MPLTGKQITKKNNISNIPLTNAKFEKEKQIKNDQKQTSSKKLNLNHPPKEKKATPKKKPPLRSLKNFRYALIYKSWSNSDLFDVALKKTGKNNESTYAFRLLEMVS